MFFLLLLHFLPFFLLPYLLILCKKKEKKAMTPAVVLIKKEETVEAPPSPSIVKEKQFKTGVDYSSWKKLYKDPKADAIAKSAHDMEKYWRSYPVERRLKEFKVVCEIYDGHKCMNPKKSKTEDETCEVCIAYMKWAAEQYSHCCYAGNAEKYPAEVKAKLEEEFYDYPGKLSPKIEDPDWEKAQARIEEEIRVNGRRKETREPQRQPETKEEKNKTRYANRRSGRYIRDLDFSYSNRVENHVGAQNNFDSVRKIYMEHRCLVEKTPKFMRKPKSDSYSVEKTEDVERCEVCQSYIFWIYQHYKESLKDEKYSAEIRKKLEEELYYYDGWPLSYSDGFTAVINWAMAKERIRKERLAKDGKNLEKEERKQSKEIGKQNGEENAVKTEETQKSGDEKDAKKTASQAQEGQKTTSKVGK